MLVNTLKVRKMKKSNTNIYERINGNYFLNSPDYVFVVSGNDFTIKHKNLVKSYENIIMCSECGILPAIVLDNLAGKGINDFTLCISCLSDFVGRKDKKNESSK